MLIGTERLYLKPPDPRYAAEALAETVPENGASAAALRRLGGRKMGVEDGLDLYEIPLENIAKN